MATEFDLLMRADTMIATLEVLGYKVYSDKFGGIMVKGSGSAAVYNNVNEYPGDNEGERLLRQAQAIYKELGI